MSAHARLGLWDRTAKFEVSVSQVLAKMAVPAMMWGRLSSAHAQLDLKGPRAKIKINAIPILVVMVVSVQGPTKEMALNVRAEKDTREKDVRP